MTGFKKFIITIIEIAIIIALVFIIICIGYYFLYRGEKIEYQQSLAKIENIVTMDEEQDDETEVSTEPATILENIFSDIATAIIPKKTVPTNTKIEKVDIDSSKFYANQLDDTAKVIYKCIYDNKENLKTGIYKIELPESISNLMYTQNGDEIIGKAFQDAWDAFVYDNPDVFYIDTNKICLMTQTTTLGANKSYEIYIGKGDNQNYLKNIFPSYNSVENALNKIETEKQKILSQCIGTDENKIKIAHDWLVDNLEYDESISGDNTYNIYGAFIDKKVVCEGYAKAFKVLMDELDIPCILVKGIATNSNNETEKHMWNYVFLDGMWYAMDVTWDDPIIEGNGFVQNNVHYRYYLKGNGKFDQTHELYGQISGSGKVFEYPELSNIDY